MTDFLNIIKTEIIDPETDIFWTTSTNIGDAITGGKPLIVSLQYLPGSADDVQLKKILDACKLDTDAYNILQIAAEEKIAWHILKNKYAPTTVLLFGVHPQQLGIAALFRLNGINNFDSTTIIPTLSLQQLEQLPQAKKDLWVNALKPLFADNQ
jgi:hypothetical protein